MSSVVIQKFKNIPLEKDQRKKCYFFISFRLLFARSLRLIASCELWNHFRPTYLLSEVYDSSFLLLCLPSLARIQVLEDWVRWHPPRKSGFRHSEADFEAMSACFNI